MVRLATKISFSVLLILVLFLNGIHSIQESDIGKNNWSMQNIGELDDITFINSQANNRQKLFFYSEDLKLFSLLSQRTGEI